MSHAAPIRPHDADWYEIRVQGRLDPRWCTYLDGVHLAPTGDGTTVLTGRAIDQAALHGLLAGLRDLDLPLVSVTRIEPEPADHHAADHDAAEPPHHDHPGEPT